MAQLALYLLGPPRLERDGAPAVTDTRKAIALLAYLVGARAPHSRDALAALFWPDYDQVRARGALRRTLSALNSALGGVGVLAGRDTLALDPAAGLQVDVDAFLARLAACRAHGHPAGEVCAACLAPLAEAVAIYRDDFLAGFTLRDSPAFDEWQFFQTETLRRDLAGALERLAAGLAAAGEWEPAIAHARRRLALDPLHEPAHRQLMRLYAWAGQRGAALRQYRECVQVLDQELGVAPLEATTRLYAAIRDNALGPPLPLAPAPGAPAAPAPPAPPAPAPAPLPAPAGYLLVGRAAEWDAMLAAYTALHGAGHVLAVEGEAGIGKSRLAAEFAAWATGRGATVIAARCYEGEQNLAYAPVMALLRAALPGPGPAAPAPAAALPAPWLAEAARLLPDLAAALPGLPAPPALDSPGAQGRFFEGLRQVLLAAAGPTPPGVLLLEDAQWADSASLDFLTYCVRRLDDAPALLLLTWRGAQAAPDPRLPALLAVAQAAGRATVLHLRRLSPAAVAELVRAAGPAAPPALAERLYQETEGLTFFVVEYLAALAAGAPGPPGEDWALPGGARDLLRARVAAAGETGRQLLHTAAVIGRSFDFDILREASGRGEEETVAALDALIGAGLVTEAPGGEAPGALTYDFSHQKLRALVYDETSLARRRLLHRRVAEALAGQTRGGRDPGARAGRSPGTTSRPAPRASPPTTTGAPATAPAPSTPTARRWPTTSAPWPSARPSPAPCTRPSAISIPCWATTPPPSAAMRPPPPSASPRRRPPSSRSSARCTAAWASGPWPAATSRPRSTPSAPTAHPRRAPATMPTGPSARTIAAPRPRPPPWPARPSPSPRPPATAMRWPRPTT